MINWKQQIPRWYWIIYWSVPALGLLVFYINLFRPEYHYLNPWLAALQMLIISGLMYQRPRVAAFFVGMAVVICLLLSSCALESRRTCPGWTNLTWTGGRIIGRAAYTPITSCAPGGLEGTGSSLTYYPAEEESRLQRENHPLP
jgi:hypothetical protein